VALAIAICLMALTVGESPGWGQGIQVAPGEQGRLRADRVRYDARAHVFLAEGNVRLTIGRLEILAARLRLEQRTQVAHASGGVSVRGDDLGLGAAQVTYEIKTRVARAAGGVVLTQKDVTVRAPQLTIALAAQTVAASGGVTVFQGRSTLSGQTLDADLVGRRAEVVGETELRRAASAGSAPAADAVGAPASREAVIRAHRMSLRWDPDEAEASGAVRILQGERVARAERARYVEATGRLDLQGDVVVEQFGARPPLSGARLAAQKVTVSLRDGGMDAHGGVSVTQEGRSAAGERAVYQEREQRVTVTGRVLMTDEDGNTVRADRVVIMLNEESFEASGNVETVFKVKPGK
jgi:lipopolysaccharide assembly outer membrane protein LptD (OstA)